MIFGISIFILGISLVSWQLWSDWKKSYILGFLSIGAIFFTGYTLLIGGASTFKNLGFISLSLLLISAFSFIAAKIRKYPVARIPFLVFTVFILFKISNANSIINPFPQRVDQQGELLVKLQHGKINEFMAYAKSLNSIEIMPAFSMDDKDLTELDDYLIINLLDESPKAQQKLISKLRKRNEVLYIEANEIINVPSPIESAKKSKGEQHYLFHDPYSKDQWSLEKTNMNELYKIIQKQKPAEKAKLFILDTGIDSEHEDLKEVYTSTEKKSDKDVKGHGTHCAGIAAAMTGNGIGISSYNADGIFEVSSIKVLADFGGGTQKGIINGMLKAIDSGADVISMSLGGRSSDSRQKAYEEVVQYADQHNTIIIVAAGNSGANAKYYAPANSKGVITVGAIDNTMNRANFSNSLEDIEMGISAPGVDILSTFPNNEYQRFSGTSMATPFVAGLVTLMKCYNPELTSREAFRILSESGINSSSNSVKTIVNPSESLKNLLK